MNRGTVECPVLPEVWCPGCYWPLKIEAKELPSPSQVAEVLVSGAKAPARSAQRPAGADSCDRDGFWKTQAILALLACHLCAL